MEPHKLAEQSIDTAQILSGAGLFFGGMVLVFAGWMKKNFKRLLEPDEEKDVTVLNAALADTKQLDKLAKSIDDLVEFLKDREEDADRHNNRIVHSLQDICDGVERQTKVFRDRTIL